MSTATDSRLFREPITLIVVSEAVGADGRTTRTETPTETTGAFRQRAAIDANNAGVVVTDEIVVYLRPEDSVLVGDRVAIRGEVYEVVSTAFPQVNHRTGELHHREVRARRSTR